MVVRNLKNPKKSRRIIADTDEDANIAFCGYFMENTWQDPFEDSLPWQQAEQLAEMAEDLYENGRMQDALGTLQQAIECGSENASWYFNAGLILDALERYEEAIEYYRKALELSGEDIEILNCLAIDYTRTAQYDLALTIFEKIERLDPLFEPSYCNRIITYTEMEQFDKAEEMFYLAQQIDADCPLCFYNIGNSLFSQGLYPKVIWCWQRTAQLDPTHPQIHYRLAQAYWLNGQVEHAKAEFLEELQNEPSQPDVLLAFGVFLLEQGEVLAAKQRFIEILENDLTNAAAYFYLAECYRLCGEMPLAASYYKNAIQCDPHLVGVRFRLAEMLCQQKSFHQAVELLKQELLLDIEDLDLEVLLAIGWLLLECQAFQDAAEVYSRILDKTEQDSRAYIGLALAMALKGDELIGRRCIEQALEVNPNEPLALFFAAWLCCLVEDWSSAGKYIRLCKLNKPNDSDFAAACREIEKQIRWGRFTSRILKS